MPKPALPHSSNASLFRLPLAVYAAVFLIYSQTWAFTWDEGYHLLAAQLMAAGKKPYLDFCFPQTPLNAYWNAAWMRIPGPGWRVPHAFAALFTIGAVVLTADFVFRRFPVEGWRRGAAIAAGLATGLNALVFQYGPLAVYGLCLFLVVAAFRVTVAAVDRRGVLPAGMAGLFAGAAAASSLLSAAAAPVLLIWMLVYNREGSRWAKLAGFCGGIVVAFTPVLRLFRLGPQQTWFNLFQYHYYFRSLYWPETTRHDIDVLTSWMDSGQGLLLGLLAASGLVYIARRSEWPRTLKAEFYLCAWLALAIFVNVGRAHPTFSRYFVLTVPFLSILCVVGLYAIGSRVLEPDRPLGPVLVLSLLFALGLGKAIADASEESWSMYQRQADKINQVTPRDAPVFADELIYFLTKRTPPPGFELSYTHKVDLPPAQMALFHIINEAEVKREVQSGRFATAYSCERDEIEEYGLRALYRQHLDMDECTVFWDWMGVQSKGIAQAE